MHSATLQIDRFQEKWKIYLQYTEHYPFFDFLPLHKHAARKLSNTLMLFQISRAYTRNIVRRRVAHVHIIWSCLRF